MSNDYGRTNLVTKFFCAKCGAPLELSYDPDVKPNDLGNNGDGITGSHKLEVKVSVHPCAKCLKPVEEITNAIKTILKAGVDK